MRMKGMGMRTGRVSMETWEELGLGTPQTRFSNLWSLTRAAAIFLSLTKEKRVSKCRPATERELVLVDFHLLRTVSILQRMICLDPGNRTRSHVAASKTLG